MKNIMTRTFFCTKCYEKGSPKKGELMLLSRTDHDDIIITLIKKNGKNKGFTPHVINFEKHGELYRLIYSCGIIGCGTAILKISEEDYDILFIKTFEIMMNERGFKALQGFTDNGYEV